MALIKIQNRIHGTTSRLPQVVNTMGISINATTTSMIGALILVSPKGTRDELFLMNYASSNVVNRLKRIPGMGSITILGSGYSVRVWIDPEKLSSMNLNVSDAAAAIRDQNTQGALGIVGCSVKRNPRACIAFYDLKRQALNSG